MENDNIKSFIVVCDELISGKFIVGRTKIARLLKICVNTPEIIKIIKHSLTDFNYGKEFEMAKAKSLNGVEAFVLPREDDKVIALVYCLLSDFDSGDKKLNAFVNKHFGSGLQVDFNAAFLRFTSEIILRFKLSILNLLGVDEKKILNPSEPSQNIVSTNAHSVASENDFVADEETLEAEQLLSSVYEENDPVANETIFQILNSLQEALECDFRLNSYVKDEALIFIKALREAIKLENIMIISALSIGFDNLARKIKSIKHLYPIFREELLSYFN